MDKTLPNRSKRLGGCAGSSGGSPSRSLRYLRASARLAFTIIGCAAIVPCPTHAKPATQGTSWHQVATGLRNIDEASLLRLPTGELGIGWRSVAPDASTSTYFRRVTAAGQVAADTQTVQAGWSAITNPGLLLQPGNSVVSLFGGIRTTDVTDPYASGSLFGAESLPAFAGWALLTGAKAGIQSVYTADGIGVVRAGDGTTVASFNGSQFQIGLNPIASNLRQVPPTGCCRYSANVATDGASGAVVGAYYSNVTGSHGIYTVDTYPGLGAPVYAPGSAEEPGQANSVKNDQLTPISGRISGDGVFVAYCTGYPTCTEVRVLRHGTTTPARVPRSNNATLVAINASPAAHLWVLWYDRSNQVIRVVRSNQAVTAFTDVATLTIPRQSGSDSQVWKVKGEGSSGPLDVVITASVGSGTGLWHRRLVPQLALSCLPKVVSARRTTTVTCKVTDAGDGVPDAPVTLGAGTKLTSSRGTARFKIKPSKKGRIAVTAAAPSALGFYPSVKGAVVVK